MEIRINQDGKNPIICLTGRLDTTTSPDLEKLLGSVLPEAESLIFDLEDLEYISSAGLRVILIAQKAMQNKGKMKIVHVSEVVMDIFKVTGFDGILTIE